MAESSIKAYFGGDTKGLRIAVEEANTLLSGFGKSVKALGKGFVGAFAVGAVLSGFTRAINSAQELRDKAIEAGTAVDKYTNALAMTGDAIDQIGKLGVQAFGAVANTIQTAVIYFSQFIVGADVAADAYKRLNDEAKRGEVDKQAKALNDLAQASRKGIIDRAEGEQKLNAIMKEQQRLLDIIVAKGAQTLEGIAARKELIGLETQEIRLRNAIEKKGFDDDLKWTNERLKLERTLKEQKLASLKPEERVLALTKEVTDLKKQQSKYTKDDNEFLSIQVQINDANKAIEQERLDIAQKAAKEEKKITEEKQKQLGAIAGIMGGSRFNEASDETLAEVARRNRSQAQRVRGDVSNQGIGQSLEAARLEEEAMNAERELSFRRRIRQDFATGGESLARRNFQGDPTQFDRIFSQIVKGQTIDEKNLDVLTKLEQLARRGIPVVLQGENT